MTIEAAARGNIERDSPWSRGIGNLALDHRFGNERLLFLLLGGGLLLFGARSRRGLPLALAGGMLLYRGAIGLRAFSKWLGLSGAETHPQLATSVSHRTGIKVERAVVIQKSPEELYRFWRDLANLPRFMSQHVSVERRDDARSHWKVQSVAGATFDGTPRSSTISRTSCSPGAPSMAPISITPDRFISNPIGAAVPLSR